MKNYQQDGNTTTWLNDTGAAVVSGELVIVGDLAGVAVKNIAIGESGTLITTGVVTLPKVTANDIAHGVTVYATSAGNITTTASGNKLAGKAWTAAAAGTDAVDVKLNV
ncbi:DUF2190 family protein [Motilimonas cestriensis]|uniref:DUF2190 family protein n=1 Tax=Motilimonas cestriensis TaxID=2742685 RepID=UPI003DA4D905